MVQSSSSRSRPRSLSEPPRASSRTGTSVGIDADRPVRLALTRARR